MINIIITILYIATVIVVSIMYRKALKAKQGIIEKQEKYIEFLEEEKKKMVYNPFIQLGKALGAAGAETGRMKREGV